MKKCTKCNTEQLNENFAKKASSSDGLQSWCRDCKKADDASYYQQNKDKYLRYNREQYERANKALEEAKDAPCTDCGVRYPPYVMDFDHLDPDLKKFNVGNARKYSLKILMEEIKKCELVCANCHRIRTHDRAQALVV